MSLEEFESSGLDCDEGDTSSVEDVQEATDSAQHNKRHSLVCPKFISRMAALRSKSRPKTSDIQERTRLVTAETLLQSA